MAAVLSGLAAGCSSSTPSYCAAAANLKTSVSNLGNVDVAKNGLGSLQTALNTVTSNAQTFAADAGSAFAPQTTALQKSLSGLESAIRARAEVPRDSHAVFDPPSGLPHPVALLEEQAATRVPELVPVRWGRMMVSSFTACWSSTSTPIWPARSSGSAA